MFGTLTFVVPLWTVLMSICAGGLRGLTTAHAGGASGKKADLDQPTDLRADWIDNLTVKVSWSWKRHKGLPKDCIIMYVVKRNDTELQRDIKTHFLEELLSKSPAKWMYKVHAVGTSSCSNRTSLETNVTIETQKPHAVDRDFKCFLYKSDMKCSWTSDPASPVTLSYRECGTRLKLRGTPQPLRECDKIYTKGRTECQLSGNFLQKDLCMVANTSNGISTFKAPKVLALPNMKISEKGTVLQLTWEPLEVEPSSSLFNICYSICDKPLSCREHSLEEGSWEINYDKSCLYKFQYRLQTGFYSTQIYSDWSEEILYRFTDRTLTVVAIVIPVILSACVILSCICFRRHKHIICPEVPDPSTIFKEMINGNKEMKPSATMYTPVREPVEPIIIVPHIPHSSGPVPT